jgi:transposase InsO family protein
VHTDSERDAKKKQISEEDLMLIAENYISQGFPVVRVLTTLGIPTSNYYYKPVANPKPSGVKPSEFTKTQEHQLVSNEKVVEDIKEILSHEFVDYGYLKVTYWLRQQKKYIINKKKVYSLMKQNGLLERKKQKRFCQPRKWVQELVPQPKRYFEHLEIDIKNVYIPGQRKKALVVSIIDVYSRWVLGHYMNFKISHHDIITLFDKLFNFYGLPEKVYIRNDNGSQFISGFIRTYYAKINVTQEFTRPATPQQNAHIESYHSILEKVICQRFDFDDLLEAQVTFNRFIEFYNFERIHSGIGYTSPAEFLKKDNLIFCLNEQLKNVFNCTHIFSRKLQKIKEEYKIG